MKLAEAVRLARSVKVSHAQSFVRHVAPEVVRPARVIWNRAIGALFVVLAIPALFKAAQIYPNLPTDSKAPFTFGVCLIFAVLMVFFAFTSFQKARRICNPSRNRKRPRAIP